MQNIELEFRAIVSPVDYKKKQDYLEQHGTLLSETQRLSFMSFHKINDNEIDVRVRITNGMNEIVIKKGNFESHDRVEVSQPLNKDQFLGMIKIISVMGMSDMRVGERHTLNYDVGNNIIVSLVSSGKVVYLEFEKISNDQNVEQNTYDIMKHILKMNVTLIKVRQEYLDFCDSFQIEGSDWIFHNLDEDYLKLESILEKY